MTRSAAWAAIVSSAMTTFMWSGRYQAVLAWALVVIGAVFSIVGGFVLRGDVGWLVAIVGLGVWLVGVGLQFIAGSRA